MRLFAFIVGAGSSSYLDSVMHDMETETPGSVDWFIEWGKEEDILEMYKDVILGDRPIETAIVHNHQFQPLAASTYVGILYYHQANITVEAIQEIFTKPHFRSLIPRPLTHKEIKYQLKVYLGLTTLTSRMFDTIYVNRDQPISVIAESVKQEFQQTTSVDVAVGKIAVMVRIWHTLCIKDLVAQGISDSCFYDRTRDRWWLIGPGRVAMIRALILGLIQRS